MVGICGKHWDSVDQIWVYIGFIWLILGLYDWRLYNFIYTRPRRQKSKEPWADYSDWELGDWGACWAWESSTGRACRDLQVSGETWKSGSRQSTTSELAGLINPDGGIECGVPEGATDFDTSVLGSTIKYYKCARNAGEVLYCYTATDTQGSDLNIGVLAECTAPSLFAAYHGLVKGSQGKAATLLTETQEDKDEKIRCSKIINLIWHILGLYWEQTDDFHSLQTRNSVCLKMVYPLVNVYITNWKITIFHGKIQYFYGDCP